MAKYEDYVVRSEDGIDQEITQAQKEQQTRQTDSTSVDWETRYKELEKLNSRQAQTLGEYRQTIDTFIANPTPSTPDTSNEPPKPITYDDLIEDPNAAISHGVDAHPAIQEIRALRDQLEADKIEAELNKFATKHSDYKEIYSSPEFQNWVVENPTRIDLHNRGNTYDFNAADALFSLYKAEKGMAQAQQNQRIQDAELVNSSGQMVIEPPKFSRSEYIYKLTRSKQGDLDAEAWVNANRAQYRMALEAGNVRD
jgi:hypothetical protein